MHHALYPRLETLVVSSENNVMTADWVSPVSFDPPLLIVSVGKTRFTHELIKQSKEFVVAIPSAKMISSVLKCGSVSGRKMKDKFEYSGLKRKKSRFVKIPSIEGAARNIECKLVDAFDAGDHTIFVGKILNIEKTDAFLLFHAEDGFFPSKKLLWNTKSLPEEKDAFLLLESMECPEDVLRHTKIVVQSLEVLLKKSNKKIDVKLARLGVILHDIGRCMTHGIEHGVVGGQIIRQFGMPEAVARIVERHVGAGITKEEAAALGMPAKDFIPETIEEKFVCYADKLAEGEKISGSVEEEAKKWERELGPNHAAIKRLYSLEEEMKNYFKV